MAVNASRRRMTLGVVGVVVVVILVVAGYIYYQSGRPSAAAGPTTPDSTAPTSTAPVKDPVVSAAPPALKPFEAAATVQQPAKFTAHMAAALANPKLTQLSGVVLDGTTGKVLWSKDATDPRLPASTAKLLTGAALLTSVNPDARFVTKVVQGAQPGDIVFVGGGDVTLSARQTGTATVYPGAPTVADLAAQVKASGVQVKRIILDTSAWTGPDLAQGWDVSDIRGTPQSRQGFITYMQPLMVDGDRTDPSNEDSPRTGDPAKTAGKALALALGVPNAPLVNGTAPADAKVLGEVYSQPMSTLLAQALVNSDNTLADALAREVAIARGAPASFQGASAAILEALRDNLKIDTVGIQLYDGSGMSTFDQVPPDVMAQILYEAVSGKVPGLRNLLTGLPVAGATGTLDTEHARFVTPASRPGVGWVRAKTGSINVTYAMAGYTPSVDGHMLVFSINDNGVDNSTTDGTRAAQDQFAATLRTCGCS